MKISFRTKTLQKEYEQKKHGVKTYGEQIHRKYVQRINILKSAGDLEELKAMPGLRCHPLKGDRKGQWSINLNRFYRLVFTVSGENLELAKIEEVSKHYDH